MKTAISEGEAKGRIEGRVEGRTEEKLEIARNMKREGFDSVIIARMTGLSPEKIERLQ
jgi:predicted transposase/invertase (TIGR01784 family)